MAAVAVVVVGCEGRRRRVRLQILEELLEGFVFCCEEHLHARLPDVLRGPRRSAGP